MNIKSILFTTSLLFFAQSTDFSFSMIEDSGTASKGVANTFKIRNYSLFPHIKTSLISQEDSGIASKGISNIFKKRNKNLSSYTIFDKSLEKDESDKPSKENLIMKKYTKYDN